MNEPINQINHQWKFNTEKEKDWKVSYLHS